MEEYIGFAFSIVVITLLVHVSGYPNGRIEAACSSMEPIHGPAKTQTTPPPCTISVTNSTYSPGDKLTVTLEGLSGQQFTGFLLRTGSVGKDELLGTFTIIDSKTQALTCSGKQNSAVSHVSKLSKQRIQVEWVAPSSSEDIQFKATFLQGYTAYWTNIKGPIMKRSLVNNPAATTPASTEASMGPQPSSTNSLQISSDGCGTSKFCFNIPPGCSPLSNPDCYFMSSSARGSDGLQLEISGKSDGYIAVGFSDDKIMGNDDIYLCGTGTNGRVQILHAFSTGKTQPNTLPQGKIENDTALFNNGVIKCSFITRNQISTQQRMITDLYYIFLATGPFSGEQMGFHPQLPFITEQKVNISSFQVVSGSAGDRLIIKSHGALMLIAWMTTGSIGMLMARHFKTAAKTLVLGKAVWFQVHFGLMIVTVVATIIAFILAFVSRLGWSYNKGAHPVLGCIVMGLSLIQPFVAFFRPAPQSDRRPVFNWFHRFNALVIKAFAVASIFLGLQLIDSSTNQWLSKVMGGFLGWEVLMFILLDGNQMCRKKEVQDDPDNKVNAETLLLLIYVSGNLAFLLALLAGIKEA